VAGLAAVLLALVVMVAGFRFAASQGMGLFGPSEPAQEAPERPAAPGPRLPRQHTGPRQTPAQKLRAEIEQAVQAGADALSEGNLSRARRAYEEVKAKTEGKPQFASLAHKAKERLHWINLTQHPGQRYVILGATVGGKTLVRVRDTRDGLDYRPRLGEAFGECKLLAYDAEEGFAEIEVGGRVFTIRPPE